MFGLLGDIGKDPEVIAQSKKITAAYLANPESVEGTLAQTAMRIAATNGDEQLFNQLQSMSVSASNPEIAESALFALGNFTDPVLEKRALEYAVSGKVKNQDSIGLIGEILDTRETHPVAWEFVQQNWDKVKAQITTGSGARLVGAAGTVCTVQMSASNTPASSRPILCLLRKSRWRGRRTGSTIALISVLRRSRI